MAFYNSCHMILSLHLPAPPSFHHRVSQNKKKITSNSKGIKTNLLFPHTVDLVPYVLLKQRTGSIPIPSWDDGGLPSPLQCVWFDFWSP